MPPSPQEIKARLDKVVDQEGNVSIFRESIIFIGIESAICQWMF